MSPAAGFSGSGQAAVLGKLGGILSAGIVFSITFATRLAAGAALSLPR